GGNFMSLKQLRDKREAMAKELRALNERSKGHFTNEAKIKWDEIVDQISSVDAELRRYETILDVEAGRLHRQEEPGSSGSNPEYKNAFNHFLRSGDNRKLMDI